VFPDKSSYCLFVLTLWSYLVGSAADGKIGGTVQSFQAQNSRILAFRSRSPKEGKVYYMYSLRNRPATQDPSFGFAGGLTLTTSADKIIGESLVLRLGNNPETGKEMAREILMTLTYEAIGKPPPNRADVQAKESEAYSNAVFLALAGLPQTLKYKGYPMRITLAKTNENDLLLAITPEYPAAK